MDHVDESNYEDKEELADSGEATYPQLTGGTLPLVQIAELICKTIALCFFTYAANTLFYFLLMLFSILGANNFGDRLLSVAITGFLPLGDALVGFLLWKLSRPIGRWMISNTPTLALSMGLSARTWMRIAFATTGIYILLINLKELLHIFIRMLLFIKEQGIPYSEFWKNIEWQANLWATLLSCVIALWLILGSRGVAKLVLRLRHQQENGNSVNRTEQN